MKTKADILYESLANFTDEEGAIECGAKMRDFARELERELDEQVVCNGKGGEREAALLTKVDNLERELAKAKAENARLRRCMQYLIDNGYTAGTGGQTPDELCDDLLPEEWPSCLPLPKLGTNF